MMIPWTSAGFITELPEAWTNYRCCVFKIWLRLMKVFLKNVWLFLEVLNNFVKPLSFCKANNPKCQRSSSVLEQWFWQSLLPASGFSLLGWVCLCTHLVGSCALLCADYHEKLHLEMRSVEYDWRKERKRPYCSGFPCTAVLFVDWEVCKLDRCSRGAREVHMAANSWEEAWCQKYENDV